MPKEKQRFKSNSHFNKALELYRFDKKLRLFLFNEIEKIEVSFRSTLANMVAEETENMFWITEPSIWLSAAIGRRQETWSEKQFYSPMGWEYRITGGYCIMGTVNR